MIESNISMSVPGTNKVEIFPYIRKIDLMSSNSYILSGEDQIAIIDTGALDDQFNHLMEKIIAMHEEKPRPTVIYLTHVHLDHCFQLKRCKEFKDLVNIIVAAQEKGAEALEAKDAKMTLADLLGKDLSRISVDVKLLSNRDVIIGGERQMLLDGTTFSYITNSLKIPQGPMLDSQIVSLGKEDQLEIYSTPGHSPDSICIQAGSFLFVGDLFFAPNPGMAGAYGWSQSDLLASIRKVLWILERKNIRLCCSGHGKAIDVDMALRTLRSMYQDVMLLSSLEEITPRWVRNVAMYAEDLLRELDRLLTIITGRLGYISLVLDELEEISEAYYVQSLVDAKLVDELFTEFNGFVKELRLGRKLDWDLVHKAGQIVRKLEIALENRALGSVLNQSLLKRANRILNDYAVAYRGFRPTYYVAGVDLNKIIKEIQGLIKFKPYEDNAILEAESYEDYIWALRTRIAHINMLENVTLDFEGDGSLPLVRMDKERFIEVIIDLLERLTSAGAKEMRIIASSNEGLVAIRIEIIGAIYEHPLKNSTLRFFERMFALCGGFIGTYTAEEGPIVEIEFLPI